MEDEIDGEEIGLSDKARKFLWAVIIGLIFALILFIGYICVTGDINSMRMI